MKQETSSPEEKREIQVSVRLSGKDAERFDQYMQKQRIRRRAVAAYQMIMSHLDADEEAAA